MAPSTFEERADEMRMDSLPGVLNLLASSQESRLSEYSIKDIKALIERARALEDLWTAMKEPWVMGYSPKVAEAMKRLKELERAG